MKFKRKISFSGFKHNNVNSSWILIWYGKCYEEGKMAKIEAYFLRVDNSKPKSRVYSEDDFGRLGINFNKTYLFPIGSVFNHKGHLVSKECKQYFTYYEKSFTFYPENNFQQNGFTDILESSLFKMLNKKYGLELFNSTYYSIHNKWKNINVVFSPHVFLRFFFGFSSDMFKYFSENLLEENLVKFEENDNKYVFYNGDVITESDAFFLSKYKFAHSRKVETKIRALSNFFYKIKLSKKSHSKGEYLIDTIPFSYVLDYKLRGIYINPYGEGQPIFLVTGITNCNPHSDEYPFFKEGTINCIDINKVKEVNEKDDYEDSTKNRTVRDVNIRSVIKDVIKQETVNSSRSEIEIEEIIDSIFLEGPHIESDLAKLDIDVRRNSELSSRLIILINDIKETVRIYNERKEVKLNLDWFEITEKVVDKLTPNDSHIVLINDYIQIKISDITMDVYELRYFDSFFYYLIESGSGCYSALIRNVNFSQIDYQNLIGTIDDAINIHDFSWSRIRTMDLLKDRLIKVLRPIKHQVKFSDEAYKIYSVDLTVNHLKEKIELRIVNDRDEIDS